MSGGRWLSAYPCSSSLVLEVTLRDKYCCCESRGSDGFSRIPPSNTYLISRRRDELSAIVGHVTLAHKLRSSLALCGLSAV